MNTSQKWDTIVLGAGASGCFFAANLPSNLASKCLLLEKGKQPMQKVKISGGGRCNVTHACFDIPSLVEHYPRGKKELRSVFSKFQPGDTFEWFQSRGVNLEVEEDMRVFPDTHSSQTIIDLILSEIHRSGAQLQMETTVDQVSRNSEGFVLRTNQGTYECKRLVFAGGGNAPSWKLLSNLGIEIIPPVPSLFTFRCSHALLRDLSGISVADATLSISTLGLEESGPVLITHRGLSGPGILRLSAWGAIGLHDLQYRFTLRVNWIGQEDATAESNWNAFQETHWERSVYKYAPFDLPKRLWEKVCMLQDIPSDTKYKHLLHLQRKRMLASLVSCDLPIAGKNTFKHEFVTAGGVDLKEIDFRTMQSKQIPDLTILGESLNIDAITGGFNFQACWSEAWIAAQTYRTEIKTQ